MNGTRKISDYSEYFIKDGETLYIRTDFRTRIKELRGIHLRKVLSFFLDGDETDELLDDSNTFYSRKNEDECVKRYIPRKLRIAVFKRDGYMCKSCGSETELSIDHIIPKTLGGKTTMENCQVLCMNCNRRKGARSGAILNG